MEIDITEEIDVKRFYFNGKLKIKCPECGHEFERDFNDDYLSYPKVGDALHEYCCECEHEWNSHRIKRMMIELEEETK
jgi:hypothetical protein